MPAVPRFRDLQDSARRELWASLALRHCPGLGTRTCKLLLEKFGSAYDAVIAKKSWQTLGVKPEVIQMATAERWREPAKVEWNALVNCNPRILLWQNDCYPAYLREISDPPLLLYGEGDFTLLASPCIAVIGSRNASEHGRKVARHIARNLASCGICVAAGMARGIDCSAHQAAIKEVGRSIGVLGNGIDVCYPPSNGPLFDMMKTQGLLLTEFAPGCKPAAKNFPIRNRLISGLALGVLVVEAADKSGSLITAKYALEQNREVYAVPGPAMDAHFSGCQRLVREGARSVFTTEDILRDLAPRLQTYGLETSALSFPNTLDGAEDDDIAPLPSLTEDQSCTTQLGNRKDLTESYEQTCFQTLKPDQQKLVCYLNQHGASHIDRLAEALDEPITSLNTILMALELSGYVKRLPGAHYDLVRI